MGPHFWDVGSADWPATWEDHMLSLHFWVPYTPEPRPGQYLKKQRPHNIIKHQEFRPHIMMSRTIPTVWWKSPSLVVAKPQSIESIRCFAPEVQGQITWEARIWCLITESISANPTMELFLVAKTVASRHAGGRNPKLFYTILYYSKLKTQKLALLWVGQGGRLEADSQHMF